MVLAPISGTSRINPQPVTEEDTIEGKSPITLVMQYLANKGMQPNNPKFSDAVREALTANARDPTLIPGLRNYEPPPPDQGNDPANRSAQGGPGVGQRGNASAQIEGPQRPARQRTQTEGQPTTSAAPTSGYASATPDAMERSMQKATQPQTSYDTQNAIQQDPSSGGVAPGGVQTPADVLAAAATRGLDPTTMMALAGAGGAGGLGYLVSQFGRDTPVVGPNFGPGVAPPQAPPGPPEFIGPPTAEEMALRDVNPVNPDLLGNRRIGAVSPAELPPTAAPRVPFAGPRPTPPGGWEAVLRALQSFARAGKLGLR